MAEHASSGTGRPPGARPVVLVPARFAASTSALRYRAEVSAAKLIAAVHDAGGEPLVLHPEVPDDIGDDDLDALVRDRIWMADGILLPGGGDLAARWSGQAPHETQYDVDETQDAFDLALARVAIDDRIPLLAICRGTQVVNVARGGTSSRTWPRRWGPTTGTSCTRSRCSRDPRCARWCPWTGCRSPVTTIRGWVVWARGCVASAYAEDGTIEAVALDGHDGWYLGVQWHPEDTAATDSSRPGVFEAFVEAIGPVSGTGRPVPAG